MYGIIALWVPRHRPVAIYCDHFHHYIFPKLELLVVSVLYTFFRVHTCVIYGRICVYNRDRTRLSHSYFPP